MSVPQATRARQLGDVPFVDYACPLAVVGKLKTVAGRACSLTSVSQRENDSIWSWTSVLPHKRDLSVYVCVKFRLGSERIQLPGLTSPSQRAGACWLGHSLGEEWYCDHLHLLAPARGWRRGCHSLLPSHTSAREQEDAVTICIHSRQPRYRRVLELSGFSSVAGQSCDHSLPCLSLHTLHWSPGDQYKEIEENNRMGKTRGTKGIFHAKMG